MALPKPSMYIVGTIIFAFFLMSGLAMMAEFRGVKSTFASDSDFSNFNATFNKYEDLQASVSTTDVGDVEPNLGAFGPLNALIEGAWNVLKNLGTTFSFMQDVYIGLTSEFGVPKFVAVILQMLVTILFAFGLYAAIFRLDI